MVRALLYLCTYYTNVLYIMPALYDIYVYELMRVYSHLIIMHALYLLVHIQIGLRSEGVLNRPWLGRLGFAVSALVLPWVYRSNGKTSNSSGDNGDSRDKRRPRHMRSVVNRNRTMRKAVSPLSLATLTSALTNLSCHLYIGILLLASVCIYWSSCSTLLSITVLCSAWVSRLCGNSNTSADHDSTYVYASSDGGRDDVDMYTENENKYLKKRVYVSLLYEI